MSEEKNHSLGELEELPRFRNHRVYQVTTTHHDEVIQNISTWKEQSEKGVQHRDQVQIRPNDKYVFEELKGPGKITNIWCTAMPLAKEDKDNPLDISKFTLKLITKAAPPVLRMYKYRKFPHLLTKIYIKIFFDDADEPSVNAPLGSFFGTGFGEYKHFMSRYVGMTAGGYVSQFRMPFKKKARVEIANTTDDYVCLAFYGAVTYNRYENLQPIENMGYFHAKYNQEYPTKEGIPYMVLDTKEGRGHFVGFTLNCVNKRRKHGFAYLEGNTKFYVDGEKEPSIEFTGTEDIFQGAWYYMRVNRKQSEFYAPYHGLTIKSFNKRDNLFFYLFSRWKYCKSSQYRFFPEGIPFKSKLQVTIHHGEFDEIPTNYNSTAYYYHEKP
ncbi:MAG: DUF2961 domain-containing protein [Candidatus Lokiarchaeota archaeon]|nr:DUF2961 domain-containing protein [Candidatus Lokiarchaeota archaeon]